MKVYVTEVTGMVQVRDIDTQRSRSQNGCHTGLEFLQPAQFCHLRHSPPTKPSRSTASAPSASKKQPATAN